MKKHLLFVAIILSNCIVCVAQNLQPCSADEMFREAVNENPDLLKAHQELETFTQQYIARHGATIQSNGNYIIPIVVHVIHNYGPENISDAQVLDGVRIWNQDFQKMNPETANIVPSFQAIAANCGIEFRLATIDPNGNCTNGIERFASLETYIGSNNAKLNPWPYDQYLNVWVCAVSGGGAAYAYYPGTAPTGKDGILIQHDYFGSIGTSNSIRAHVLTHESGHCFNLKHCWGDSNNPGVTCGDDGVFDTPITKGWSNACPPAGSVCTPGVIENVQNFMEYSYCYAMFTEGQKARMEAALNSSVGYRNNLWTPANLLATGTQDGAIAPLCSPVADFNTVRKIVCQGNTIQYKDYSWRAKPNSWNWTFEGGNPYNSTDSLPMVRYDSIGTFAVTLKVNSIGGADSLTRTAYITVLPDTQYLVPASESFEQAFPPQNTYIVNPDNGQTWQAVTTASSEGLTSMKIHCFSGNPKGQVDEFITPAYDFSNYKDVSISFDVAHAQKDTTKFDYLKVYYSNDCGASWFLRYSRTGTSLATAPVSRISFTPTPDQWRTDVITFPLAAKKPATKFKFQSVSGAGNNIYVDNIRITGTYTGIDEQSASSGMNIYPNPATKNHDFTITLDLKKAAVISAELIDITGRKVYDIANGLIPAGANKLVANTDVPPGVYLVKVNGENISVVQRLVIN